MPKTKKRLNTNRTIKKILRLARERNVPIPITPYRLPFYPLYKPRPKYSRAGKATRRRSYQRGGNSSSSILTEVTVPFVDRNNAIQNTYSRLVSGTLQAQENGNV